jgi:hypothetical protein
MTFLFVGVAVLVSAFAVASGFARHRRSPIGTSAFCTTTMSFALQRSQPTLRAIAAADAHNLVFQRDYRVISATTKAHTS